MIRDVQILSLGNEEILIATDNSGGVGMKKDDVVNVPYEVVSYYSFRVAAMELLSAGAIPSSILLQNFCGDEAWEAIVAGVERGLRELEIPLSNIAISGSSESNFTLLQSALGVSVIGKKNRQAEWNFLLPSDETKLAVIGRPLVGEEVILREQEVAPLALLERILSVPGVHTFPIGSKGIRAKVERVFHKRFERLVCNVDIEKSSGPATCFLCVYQKEYESTIRTIAGNYFHELVFGDE